VAAEVATESVDRVVNETESRAPARRIAGHVASQWLILHHAGRLVAVTGK